MPDASSSYACEPCRVSKLGCDKSRLQCYGSSRMSKKMQSLNGDTPGAANDSVSIRVHIQEPHSSSTALLLTDCFQKQNRVPCRQLELKCDRKQPRGRCLKGDGGKDCRYPAAVSVDVGDGIQGSEPSVPLWKQRFHTKLHWSEVLENVSYHVDNIFGNIGPLHNAPQKTLLSYIPPRCIADLFVKQPNAVHDWWLAQLFVVVAMGSKFRGDAPPDAICIAPSQLFEAAQVCLQRTPFMIRPQQTRSASCLECDALWPATGLIVRLAILLGLHSAETRYCHGASSKSTSARNRLWATVILHDLRQSLAAGMPVIPPSSDLIAEPLFHIDQVQHASSSSRETFSFPLILYDVLLQIFKILELATSPQIKLSYSLIATYDRQIRNLLKQSTPRQASFTSITTENDTHTITHHFQQTLANVFFRREPHASTRYPVSYWSSLECSIALLSLQRELWDWSTSPVMTHDRSGFGDKTAARFYARLFQIEFFLAAVTICFLLVEEESPFVKPSWQDQGRGRAQAQVQARSTIPELLESCREI
ncbi:fungal specific transcription factor domain-containing protein [Aspergillus stella-maris]|uniref:fungal specific transcription factor domain-containing protein n=1 Tax=Aspergillus stella-maris TaxID=1810926 RepID=UPI003CCCB5D9